MSPLSLVPISEKKILQLHLDNIICKIIKWRAPQVWIYKALQICIFEELLICSESLVYRSTANPN